MTVLQINPVKQHPSAIPVPMPTPIPEVGKVAEIPLDDFKIDLSTDSVKMASAVPIHVVSGSVLGRAAFYRYPWL